MKEKLLTATAMVSAVIVAAYVLYFAFVFLVWNA